jgi:hypothetical protein
LHAEILGFAHPRTGKMISFRAEIPPDMAELVRDIDTHVTGS